MKARRLSTLLTAVVVLAASALPSAASPTVSLLVRRTAGVTMPQEAVDIDDRWVAVEVAATGTPAEVATALADRLGTEVVVDVELELAADDRFAEQWSLANTGQTGGVPGADIDIASAWAIERGDSSVVVAIIDSGVDLDHPDLIDRVWRNPEEIAGNGIDDDGNGFIDDTVGWDFLEGDADPDDDIGHGTGVAGIVAAAENGSGIVGVAPEVRIMPLRACSGPCPLSAVMAAVDYAVDSGATVINMSLGGIGTGMAPLEEAITAAGESDVLVVAAAGNDGYDLETTPYYPAAFPGDHIMAVAATDHRDDLPSWSNTGPDSVDLSAPGVDVLSSEPGGWAMASGTSFSAPHVAGAAALVRSLDPERSAEQVRDVLMDAAEQVPALAGTSRTGGRLDANQAVRLAGRPTALITPLRIIAGLDETVTLDASTSVARTPGPLQFSWRSWDGVVTRGPALTVTTDTVGSFTVSVTVTDGAGLQHSTEATLLVGAAFTDIDGTPFAEDILWLSAIGVTKGCTPTLFCPDDTVTRGEIAAFLTRLLDPPPASTQFTDSVDHHFGPEIGALTAAGIVRGCATDLFCPDDPVTRAQLAAMLARAYGLVAVPGSDSFVDDNRSVHQSDIEALAAAAVTRGCNPPVNDQFCPERTASRGEVAALLRRADETIGHR